MKPRAASTKMLRQLSPAGKAGYDLFVWWMRVGLSLFAAVLTALLILWPMLSTDDVSFTLSYDDVAIGDDQIRMTNPRYMGMDARGQMFNVAAASGVQPSPVDARVLLSEIYASIDLAVGRHIEARSGTGIFEADRNLLELNQNVGITSDDGYSFLAGRTIFDLATGRVESAEPIRGAGPMGNFEAGGFVILADKQAATFTGGVHMVIDPTGGRE